MPRTTIDIDSPILEELKRLQKKEGASLGALASSLLSEALASRKQPAPTRRLKWNARSMRARVDLEDKEAVSALLDERNERRRG